MMRRLGWLLIVWCCLGGQVAVATAPDVAAPDLTAAQLERIERLQEGLRCLKCEYQSIAESSSDFAKDVQRFVQARVLAGDSDAVIKQQLVDRFGDRILLDPPLQWNTVLLWGLPGVFLVGVVWRLRRAPAVSSKKPVDLDFTGDFARPPDAQARRKIAPGAVAGIFFLAGAGYLWKGALGAELAQHWLDSAPQRASQALKWHLLFHPGDAYALRTAARLALEGRQLPLALAYYERLYAVDATDEGVAMEYALASTLAGQAVPQLDGWYQQWAKQAEPSPAVRLLLEHRVTAR